MSAVTKEDVARLHAYLVVPVAVGDALQSQAPLDGETQYGLHVALSEIDPDSALLAIALSAYRIAQDFTGDIPVASALKMEADKIIQDYAPDWLAHYHSHPVQGDDLYELLSHVPEDLECMADLLESVQASIRDEEHPAHTLCSVLAIQARAHMEIADYVLTQLDNEAIEQMEEFDEECGLKPQVLFAPETAGSNIILFPAHKRR
ncbi:MAG: hypothetical protein DI551_02950 [Micavibrio aeruginosavorus]|uniref:Uncharacterized protein n=1 Tax=Micavibrio aeruginosavorus TaxID=349221 RepID=A0A2W5N2M7_9BACT|nr:MAG: hypothetical protein DI551_02950 [Micavibrio aeruginosavorus]